MNILGIGHDLIEIERIRKAHKEHSDRFLERIFTEDELGYCLKFHDPYPSLAARFAAKEAGSKALGQGIGKKIGWHDLAVVRNELGQPSLLMSSSLEKLYPKTKLILSLSHTKEIASAFVIWGDL
jgi:holo-[acyl-carrier protein] synthase